MIFLILLNQKHLTSISTRQRHDSFNLPTDIDIAGSNIPVHDHLKILSVTIDKHFTFAPHAQCDVKSCNYHIQALRRIRHLLSRDVANTIACSIVGSSRLDYCDSLLYGSTEAVLNSLQRVHNNLARTVLHCGSYNSSESNLREMH